MKVLNQYEPVLFDTVGHRVTEVHVHHNYSTTLENPADIIDAYKDAGYDVLCISGRPDWRDIDGNYLHAWPWTDLDGREPDPDTVNEEDGAWEGNRDPTDLDMIAIQGMETASVTVTHVTTMFTDYNPVDFEYDDGNEYNALVKMIESDEDALTLLAHPGRYVESDDRGDWGNGEWEQDFRFDRWFRDLHPGLIGTEVANGRLNPDDRLLWDELCRKFCPHHRVIGFGADDASNIPPSAGETFDSGRTVLLIDDDDWEPGHETGPAREAMVSGRSYVTMTDGEDSSEHLTLDSIDHDEDAGELTVTIEEDYDYVNWRSGRNTIHNGETLDYEAHSDDIHGYVRCEFVVGDNAYPGDEDHPPESILSTQPILMTDTIVQGEQA